MRSPLRPLLALVVAVLASTVLTVVAFLDSLDTHRFEPTQAFVGAKQGSATACCRGRRLETMPSLAPVSPVGRKAGDAPAG